MAALSHRSVHHFNGLWTLPVSRLVRKSQLSEAFQKARRDLPDLWGKVSQRAGKTIEKLLTKVLCLSACPPHPMGFIRALFAGRYSLLIRQKRKKVEICNSKTNFSIIQMISNGYLYLGAVWLDYCSNHQAPQFFFPFTWAKPETSLTCDHCEWFQADNSQKWFHKWQLALGYESSVVKSSCVRHTVFDKGKIFPYVNPFLPWLKCLWPFSGERQKNFYYCYWGWELMEKLSISFSSFLSCVGFS